MTEYTPETLRGWATELDGDGITRADLAPELYGHADAWAADRKRVAEAWAADRKRVAEAWAGVLARIIDRSLRICDGRVECTAFSHADYILQLVNALPEAAREVLAAARAEGGK